MVLEPPVWSIGVNNSIETKNICKVKDGRTLTSKGVEPAPEYVCERLSEGILQVRGLLLVLPPSQQAQQKSSDS